MHIALRAFAFLAALSFLSACTTISTESPIGISSGTQTDAQLTGGWKVVQFGKDAPNGPSYVFFLPLKDGTLQAMVTGWEPSTAALPIDAGWLSFEIVLGKSGANNLINAKQLLEDGKPVDAQPAGYYPFLYRFEADGKLSILGIGDMDSLKDAVMAGRLAGTVSAGGTDVRITADPAALDAYFSASNQTLFTEPFLSLQRLDQ